MFDGPRFSFEEARASSFRAQRESSAFGAMSCLGSSRAGLEHVGSRHARAEAEHSSASSRPRSVGSARWPATYHERIAARLATVALRALSTRAAFHRRWRLTPAQCRGSAMACDVPGANRRTSRHRRTARAEHSSGSPPLMKVVHHARAVSGQRDVPGANRRTSRHRRTARGRAVERLSAADGGRPSRPRSAAYHARIVARTVPPPWPCATS